MEERIFHTGFAKHRRKCPIFFFFKEAPAFLLPPVLYIDTDI